MLDWLRRNRKEVGMESFYFLQIRDSEKRETVLPLGQGRG